ncbi:TY-Chap domain-containing protein [Gordonia sp. DT218]|uniref:TY-Chap domain-containing protein n=1 Tax=Gordonia sp. DT218 TaxID=3416659 RepID=UPI003CE747AC
MSDFDLDATVDGAWRAFRANLADRLAGMAIGNSHTVAQSEFPEGPHGAIAFTVTRAHRVRATVDAGDLHTTPEYLREQLAAMVGAGWRLLRDGRLIYEVGQRRVDKLAQVAVDTLRDIWEIVHPAFLEHSGPTPREASIAVGTIPETQRQLGRLVVEALENMAGQRIVVDDDGDIPLPTGRTPSWLRVLADEATVEFFGTVVDVVPSGSTAAEFVATEAPRWPGITLVLRRKTLMAFQTIEMTAFHRENLTAGLGRWLQFMHDEAPQIISAITGAESPELSPPPEGDLLPDPLQTLIVLDEDGSTLDPHEVAEICRHDQSAILRYIRTSQEQYLEWSNSAAEADAADDADEAAACRHEEQAWRATTAQLRAALRIVALRGDGNIADRDPHATTQ